jgi:hypothetical protein
LRKNDLAWSNLKYDLRKNEGKVLCTHICYQDVK